MKKRRKNIKGMSLVEIMLAIIITVFASLAIVQAYLSNIGLSDMSRDYTVAMSHLSCMMEAIQCTPFNNLQTNFPNGVNDGPAGNSYATLVGGYALKNEHVVVTYVNPGGDPLEISARISWQEKTGLNRSTNLVTKRTR